MKIEVKKGIKSKYKLDFPTMINEILETVPETHILGLHKIQILGDSPEKKRRSSYGFYYGKREGENQPRIVICVNNIYSRLPRLLLKIKFIPKMFLAGTLYHEIAHHYQRLKHGFKKDGWEKDADIYAKKMMREHFIFQLYLLKILHLLLKVLFYPLFAVNKIRGRKKE